MSVLTGTANISLRKESSPTFSLAELKIGSVISTKKKIAKTANKY
jgi:hypothetical protein